MRRAAESELNVRFVLVDKSADIEPELDTFFDLMVHDPNKANFLHPAMREQMTAVLRAAHEHGYLWLGFFEIDGVKTAASLNFDYGNKLWGYNSGVSREHMELSPGWVLLGHTIQWCCENGRYEFDFMRGDEDYKYRFGGVNQVCDAVTINKQQGHGVAVSLLFIYPPPLTPPTIPRLSICEGRPARLRSLRVSQGGLRHGVSTHLILPSPTPVL
jgi:CelD/BcsL family acetyltransferase involved in cellulose biosynthesis